MVKRLFFLVLTLFLLMIPLTIMRISNDSLSIPKVLVQKDDTLGILSIHKINIKESFYPKDSPKNTIDQHVSILKESIPPTEDNSILILAAHSGTAGVSYFKDLNQLEIDDEINLIYQNKKYTYLVKDIYREKKNGYIHINKEQEKQLVLTTCDPIEREYQIIVNCIEKES